MKKKSQNTTNSKRITDRASLPSNAWWPILAIILVLAIWQFLSGTGIIPKYLLPSPIDMVIALITDFSLLITHAKVTIIEAVIGLGCGIVIGFFIAVIMDRFERLYKAFYPLLVITQTIPVVAIAPLLVLWFGYEMLPKVILIVIMTFFPITISLLTGFRSADKDTINLMRTMGATKMQIFWHVKFPGSLGAFFSSLRISASYAVVGAVISEWLGGFSGLGVYMTRVKKAFAFDKMFAVILLISILSLLLIWLINVIQKKCTPWEEHTS